MSRVSIESRIRAINYLIDLANGSRSKPRHDVLALAVDHARQAVSALVWIKDDPEAQALMKAQAERARNEGAARP